MNTTIMKKVLFLLFALTMSLTASAQFEEGKWYGGASLSGLDFSYQGSRKLSLDVQAKAGYCFMDNWMVTADAGIDTNNDYTNLSIGVGVRYYIIQNGLFLGAGCHLKQVDTQSHNDFMPGIEAGYCYFLNRHVSVEPSIYYDQSFKSHKDYSTIGLKIGVGIYF